MKRLSLICGSVWLIALNLSAQAPAPVKNEAALYNVAYRDLAFGNPAYTHQVLQAWKAFDENRFDKIADLFTDDVAVVLSDGTLINGKADLLQGIKGYRDGFTSMTSEVAAVTTLKSPAHPDQDVTVIWAEEHGTKKDGSAHKAILHEVWFFNSAGKVMRMHQYALVAPKE